jgi:hypothetical protein
MTKSNSSSETSRHTTKINVKPCCFKTTKLSPSSSSDSSLDISPPIQDYLNILNSTSFMETCDTITPTLQDLLNLTTSSPSPNHITQTSLPTNEVSFTPMEIFHTPPTSPTQQGYYPSPPSSPQLTFMELLHSNPLSSSPLIEALGDLPPRPSNPPTLPLYDTTREMENQNEPHQPSVVESLAYRYARPSIFPQDQGHICQPSFVFHPIFKTFHTNEAPSFRHYVDTPPQEQPPHEHSQNLDSLFSSYKKIEASLWNKSPTFKKELKTHLNNLHAFKNMVDSQINHVMQFHMALHSSSEGTKTTSQPSTFAPSTSNDPPPNQTSFSPYFSRHDCDHCERTARISEKCRQDIHELTDEMRFILNHILERLESLSHQPQS